MFSDRLHEMNPARIALLDQYCQWWLDNGTCTKPIDENTVSQAVESIYRLEGFGQRPVVLFCDSPLQMMKLQFLISAGANLTGDEVRQRLTGLMSEDAQAGQILSDLLQTLTKSIVGQWPGTSVPASSGVNRKNYDLEFCLRCESAFAIPYHMRLYLEETCKQRIATLFDSWLNRIQSSLSWQLNLEWSPLRERIECLFPHTPRANPYFASSDIWWLWSFGRLATLAYPLNMMVRLPLKRIDEFRLAAWLELVDSGFAFMFFKNICFVCRRPTSMSINGAGQFHKVDGPCLEFADGFSMYCWNGIEVHPDLVRHPESITVDVILKENNLEVRRVMLAKFGEERFLRQSGAQAIQQDQCGTLFRLASGRSPVTLVKVVNSTPEPDGHFKDYFLQVPPTMKSAREAVAWTFGLPESEYFPAVET